MTTTPGTHPLLFRVGDEADILDAHGGQTVDTLRQIVRRYHAALAAELRAVNISDAEWSAIRDVLNGTLVDETSVRLLWAELDDAGPDGIAEKWKIDLPALVAKLRALTYTQSLAVVDAVERWWREQA